MKDIRVGLIGFGTIGKGVVKNIISNGGLIAQQTGIRLEIARIADIDLQRERDVSVDPSILTTDAEEVIHDDSIDIVVELIGGINPAREYVLTALRNGKHVVTANKALISKCGVEIFETARESGADVLYEASVAGCIPVIKSLRESLVANKVLSLDGIVNGTCNYILTRMQKDQMSFSSALEEAKAKGYAEADPSFDINGTDSAQKLAILASLASNSWVDVDRVYVEGIAHITQKDIAYAAELGYVLKLLAIAKFGSDWVQARVHPALLRRNHPLADVWDVHNAIYLVGDYAGEMMFYGQGAGEKPTASAVVSDIVDISRNIKSAARKRISSLPETASTKRLIPMNQIRGRYYLRFTVIDKPGVLAQITTVLGENGISISAVTQKERHLESAVAVIVMTHAAKEESIRAALKTIDSLDVVKDETLMIRIEESE
ncbi:homoserine dehydrogenase [bacterium]|nr:homoserine dehydrogenase [bacterium]